jgi:hypothetical protein
MGEPQQQVRALLASLNADHTSGRQKALRHFEDWFFANRPQLSPECIQRLLQGDLSKRGLAAECGVLSEKHEGEMKNTNSTALALLTRIVNDDLGTATSSLYVRQAFLELPLNIIQKMRLQEHILPSRKSGTYSSGFNDALTLVSIILQHWEEGRGVQGELGDLLSDEDAQDIFQVA